MTAFLLYIARGGLYLGLFYAFYLLVMRRTTFFRLNRVLLLTGSYLCLVLPLFRIRTAATASAIIAPEPAVAVAAAEPAAQTVHAASHWSGVLLGLYIAGAVITLALYLLSALKMARKIREGKSTRMEGYRLIVLEEDVPSFSWWFNVVISRNDLDENPSILVHEQMHVRRLHSLDLLLFLPLQLLFWWNPLVWITREELRLLHEFEADEGVIQNGIDATQYQLLLVRKAVGEHRFSLASGFQHAKLKNRIAMMLKTSSSRWMRWSYLAMIPLLAAFMFACNPTKQSKTQAQGAQEQEAQAVILSAQTISYGEPEAVPFDEVEVKPSFNGGDANEFSQWVINQLSYPEQAKKDKAQGRVVVQFTIRTDGSVGDVKLLRGVSDDLDAEALRVVAVSPKWEPGRKNGEAVPVTFVYPVVFKIQ